MIRKAASFFVGLALILAIGSAIAHATPLRTSGSIGFSAPCEPASPAFKAAGEGKTVATIDPAFAVGAAETQPVVLPSFRVATFEQTFPPPAPWAFPPLLNRPPPVYS